MTRNRIKYAPLNTKGLIENRRAWENHMRTIFETWDMHYDAGEKEGFKWGFIIGVGIVILFVLIF